MADSWVWKGATVLLGIAVILLLAIIGNMVYSPDKPTPQYGLFFEKPPIQEGNPGRKGGDLADTAIILECTSYNDTMKLLRAVKKSRKSDQDLSVHIFRGESILLSEYRRVRREIKDTDHHIGVSVSMENQSSTINSVLRKADIQFIIELKDTNKMGEDFADLYYLGKEVMKLDSKINCVCGGETYHENYPTRLLKRSQGNLLWPSDQECVIGHMWPRRLNPYKKHLDDIICIRPEVSRISNTAQHVTRISWNLDKYDPELWTLNGFWSRIWHDLCHAIPLEQIDWNDLKSKPDDQVYVFSYEGQSDMEYYFDKNEKEEIDELTVVLLTRQFDSMFMLHYNGRNVYIVDREIFEKKRKIGDRREPKREKLKVEKAEKEESPEVELENKNFNKPKNETLVEEIDVYLQLDEEIRILNQNFTF